MKWEEEKRKGETIAHIAKAGALRVALHRHIHDPGWWLLTCEPFYMHRRISDAPLADMNFLKREASRLILARLEEVASEL